MSAIFGETPKQEARDSALIADAGVTGELASSFPFCVSLWVHFDVVPGASETHTIFWYGDTGAQNNYVALQATRNQSNGIDVTATLRGATASITSSAAQLTTGTWYMFTVVVEQDPESDDKLITLYVDDTAQTTGQGDVGTTTPGGYDRFLLGVAVDDQDFGRFRTEHVAVWEGAGNPPAPLSVSEIAELYDERWAPLDAGKAGAIGRAPGTAYWMLVGHWSAGIDANNDQDDEGTGHLFNEASELTTKPPLQMLDTAKPVVWSGATPVMQYLPDAQSMAPGPFVHPPIPPVSRLQPHFYVFDPDPVLGTFKYPPFEIPPFTVPNFVPILPASAESANSLTEIYTTLTTYQPATDTALLARRVADAFQFNGLARGVGSVGDGLYEGYIFLRAIGQGDWFETDPPTSQLRLRGFRGTITTPLGTFTGTNVSVPLELHPLDRVDKTESIDPLEPWDTWFNTHGKRLVMDYMSGFWSALKRELDERNLCYPRVLWWDMEDWAQASRAVHPGNALPAGTFTLQLDDARASDPDHEILPGETLDDIYATFSGTYKDDEFVDSNFNQPFLSWYLGWSVVITQQAMLDSMMAAAKDTFPLAVWSDYDRFAADNTDFRFPGDTWRMAYNTPPPAQATIHGDYSSPKMYTPGNLYKLVTGGDRLMPELGVTFPQVLRNCGKARIDACVNATSRKPLAPHCQTGRRRFAAEGGMSPTKFYDLTIEDAFDVLAYTWKRGCDDLIIFIWDNQLDASEDAEVAKKLAHDAAYEVSLKLLNWIHWIPQETRGRVGRISRLGR